MTRNQNWPGLWEGMVMGAIWCVASVGWIAFLALVITWITAGWVSALLWFGVIHLAGAGLFA